jgi:hypothetical protein
MQQDGSAGAVKMEAYSLLLDRMPHMNYDIQQHTPANQAGGAMIC